MPEKPTSVRYQVFINKTVSDRLDKYLEERFGPGRKPTSSILQSAVVLLLIKEGYWDKDAPTPEPPPEE